MPQTGNASPNRGILAATRRGVHVMPAAEHDQTFGGDQPLTPFIGFRLYAAGDPVHTGLTGGGFRDFTRIAAAERSCGGAFCA